MLKKNCFILMLLLAQMTYFFGYCENLSYASMWYGVDVNNEMWILGEPQSFSSFTCYIQGDTIISDTIYQVLRMDSGRYLGSIRKTGDGSQVYYRPGKSEYLLYDFNVHVGDIISAYNGFWDTDCEEHQSPDFPITIAWEVRSIQTINGRKHIKVEGRNTSEVEWIEGIGTRSILFPKSMPCHTGYHCYWTLCAADDQGNILYSFKTDSLGIKNNCPDWETMEINNSYSLLTMKKILRDGQVLILRNGHTYTLTGIEIR